MKLSTAKVCYYGFGCRVIAAIVRTEIIAPIVWIAVVASLVIIHIAVLRAFASANSSMLLYVIKEISYPVFYWAWNWNTFMVGHEPCWETLEYLEVRSEKNKTKASISLWIRNDKIRNDYVELNWCIQCSLMLWHLTRSKAHLPNAILGCRILSSCFNEMNVWFIMQHYFCVIFVSNLLWHEKIDVAIIISNNLANTD